ncbi:hypothetical protein H0H92_008242 [Tricholoma furcatifolium]|nr:hypothetical protein H0H92_008242 [Tricholoma furcatifolium]
MSSKPDIEAGEAYARDSFDGQERQSLLPSTSGATTDPLPSSKSSNTPRFSRRFSTLHLFLAFLAGLAACGVTQLVFCGPSCFLPRKSNNGSVAEDNVRVLAPPYVGSSTVHHFPPTSPTNAAPTLFPSDVGYPGGTPTGGEAGVIATAPTYPIHTGAAQLIVPNTLGSKPNKAKGSGDFDLFKKWGNLSPWYSVGKGAFGLDSEPTVPETCRVTGLHFLHRHGARYPTQYDSEGGFVAAYGGPAKLARRLHQSAAEWNASEDLDFLNDWQVLSLTSMIVILTVLLGHTNLEKNVRVLEVYTASNVTKLSLQCSPHSVDNNYVEFHGNQYHPSLPNGIPVRTPLLMKNADTANLTPFRDRMLHSALNFAIGFFGYPLEGKYQQSITIEADGFNNTLAPYDTCPNTRISSKSDRGVYYVEKWGAIYLKDALARLQPQLKGFELDIEDMYMMQQTCAYETVALGYSKFCELFTEEEWEGFNYAYGSAFGSPLARVQGYGWIKEFLARLTHTSITEHNSSTNSTLDDNPTTFPLNQSLYVDATHEVVVLNIITALNLTNFAASGPLPYTHIPENRSFEVSKLAPFATNIQFQLLECTSVPGPQIRIIINDGVTPLTGIKGCPEQRDGMCPVDTFVEAQKELLTETDWEYDCYGDWTVPEGPAWNTTNGSPPKLDL